MPTRPSPSPTTVSAAKSEDPTALHHLGDAVDRNHLFAHAVVGLLGLLRFSALWLSHGLLQFFALRSELETGLTRRIRQRLDPSVVAKAGTRSNATCSMPAFLARSAISTPIVLAAAMSPPLGSILRTSGSSEEAAASTLRSTGRNHLGVDVAVAAVNRQAHRLQFGNLGPGFASPAQTRLFLVNHLSTLTFSSSFP
jgi:hypothetical protein